MSSANPYRSNHRAGRAPLRAVLRNWFLAVPIRLGLLLGLLSPAAFPAAALADQEPPRVYPALLQMAAEHPNDKVHIIVQRMPNQNLPPQALAALGGRVTKDLPLINGFAMEVPARAVEALGRNPSVRWITLDAPMVPAVAGGETLRDEFSTGYYSDTDGTRAWAGGWVEAGDDGTSVLGSVRVTNGQLQLGYRNNEVSRAANLAGAAYAVLTFDYRRSGLDDAYDYVAVQLSADGGNSWTELTRISGAGSDSYWQAASLNILGYATPNTKIRLATSPWLGYFDAVYIDNLQIEYALASNYVGSIRADQLALSGQGVTVAVVDSGIASQSDLQGRLIAQSNQTDSPSANDYSGHGTHVAGIIGASGAASGGLRRGVAPGVNLINVKVSSEQGLSLASDLIDGLKWILDNKNNYNIRVANISINSTVPESYLTSPLAAAVEVLWFNGIVVVVAAGNNGSGSGPVTLYPPANDPFVITVGATEDRGTASLADDTMAVFSAYGTTEDGFAKPDLVAPGRNVVSLLASTSAYGYVNHPAHRVDSSYFRMSGTSMAAPVVSGLVALLLQDEPNLTPDQVKFRLKATANAAWPAYNPARAGAGYADAFAAVNATTVDSANTGLAVSLMLTGDGGTVNSTVNWNSVNWNSVNWNSVNWNSVNWNSVNWNSVNWNSSVWDD